MTLESVLAVLGALVPLASALASALNHDIRKKQADGSEVPSAALKAGAVLNGLALNVDKAIQLAKAAKAAGLVK
jgi:hypothetical protein